MRFTRLVSLAFACCLALAGSASAAPLTNISYSVTGGNFGGALPNSVGAITGGTLTFTPNVTLSTPGSGLGAFFLSLTGPSGFFSATGNVPGLVNATGLNVSTSSIFMNSNGNTFATVSFNQAAIFGGASGTVSIYRGYSQTTVTVTPSGSSYFYTFTVPTLIASHNFTLGNEVRTIIPEPGTGALVALGVLGLGVAAGGRRALRSRKG